MLLVAVGVSVAGLIVADDGVVPVGDIDGAVRPHAHFDGTEDVALRFDDRGQLGGLKDAVLKCELMLFKHVGVVAPNNDTPLHLRWKMAAVEELHADLLDRCLKQVHGSSAHAGNRHRKSHCGTATGTARASVSHTEAPPALPPTVSAP